MSQRDELVPQQPNKPHLPPSLQASFVALPPVGTRLTQAQLQAIFGGDIRAWRDLAQLAYQSDENGAE